MPGLLGVCWMVTISLALTLCSEAVRKRTDGQILARVAAEAAGIWFLSMSPSGMWCAVCGPAAPLGSTSSGTWLRPRGGVPLHGAEHPLEQEDLCVPYLTIPPTAS